MSSDRVSIDLDDLEDDLLQATSLVDINEYSHDLSFSLDSDINNSKRGDNVFQDLEQPTLESILNEEDDLENDEIIRSLNLSLTKIGRSSNQIFDDAQSYTSSNTVDTPTRKLARSQTQQYNSTLIEQNGIVCKQAQLNQISNQLLVAIDRSDAGLPTSMAVGQLIAIGTSRGLVLLFDSSQVLKLYIATDYKDVSISALSFNTKCDRLLVGNAIGYMFMYDCTNGKCLRQINDAHPYGNAILNIKFTDDSKLACFSDSGGSVFMMEFKRTMGVRGTDSTCLFSGSRGEVCCIEPLRFEKFSETIIDKLNGSTVSGSYQSIKKNLENINKLFSKYSLLAMASFTKIFVVTLRPKLTVLFTYPLTANPKYLPIINWQFVIIQQAVQNQNNTNYYKRYVTPILSCARESSIHFFQVEYDYKRAPNGSENSGSGNGAQIDDFKFKFVKLKTSEFNYKIYNFCWLNAKTIAILDHSEKLHIVDIRTNEELQVLNNLPECVQLIYNSCFFKSLATGGYVSKALAYAGESACYQTFQCYLGQLFMLGKKSLNMFSLQNWSARIDDFINDPNSCNLDLALDLGLSMYNGKTKALIGLPVESQLRKQKIIEKIMDVLYLYVNRSMKQDCPKNGRLDLLEKHFRKCSDKLVHICVSVNRHDLLFDQIYNLLSCDKLFESCFFQSLEDYILLNKINTRKMPNQIIKNFIKYYSSSEQLLERLEKCLLHFDINSFKSDLNDIINMCLNYRLIDAYIYLFNTAYNDYITPMENIIMLMQPLKFLKFKSKSSQLDRDDSCIKFGNKLLVYIHCCLSGQAFPLYGNISDDQVSDKVRRMTFDYLIGKNNDLIEGMIKNDSIENFENVRTYPILRIFLNFDILDFLNVISMTFQEPSFEAVIGLDKKQQLIDILIEIALNSQDITDKIPSTSSIIYNDMLGNLFTFIARQIANKNNNIQVNDEIFAQIIEYLCNREEADKIEEREQALLSLLNSFAILDHFNKRFDLERLLQLSHKAKFFRVCQILYEYRSEYYEIIDCYINEYNSAERKHQVFNVVRELLDRIYEEASKIKSGTNRISGTFSNSYSRIDRNLTTISAEPRDVQLKKLQERLLRPYTLKEMINLDPTETIHLLWIEMNIDLKYLIKTIRSFDSADEKSAYFSNDEYTDDSEDESGAPKTSKENPKNKWSELLYKFMKGLFDLADLIKIDRKYINYMSQFDAEYTEIYIELICCYEPQKLVYVMKSLLVDYSYRTDECLRICRKHKNWDGAAYLLEKSGQIEAAFSLHLEKITQLIKDLQKNLETYETKDLEVIKSKIDAFLIMIVQLCQRNSCSLNDSTKEKIWFSLFDEIMRPIRSLSIDPSIEVMLNYDEVDNQEERSNQMKDRLRDTNKFFKDLGSYIINSMVGYLNLTLIIDRIVCDPLYGASNFGDIKDLMVKMLEMCSYEQTLLTKTSSLMSKDVYLKMLNYKKYSSKSFTSFTTYCNYCARPLDPNTDLNDLVKSRSPRTESGSPVTLYNCGHTFHQNCLDRLHSEILSCPLCNNSMSANEFQPTSSTNNSKLKSKFEKKKNNHKRQNSAVNSINSDNDLAEADLLLTKINQDENSLERYYDNSKKSPNRHSDANENQNNQYDSNLSDQQLQALKSIRTRNLTSNKIDYSYSNGWSNSMNDRMDTILEKKSKLQLAPANLAKFI